ncbi:uncharacterized protein LOC119161655 [Rhipicephalus microplus]|uniref:uncharacterized protein LOC119161655 n=1 Tax=Rhipicephalus microplus TaxID=6941 RepID=UPI003F6CF0C0
MSVRLAAQLFSRSTAIGLKMYREEGVEGLEDSVGTEAFTRIFNDVFDALNAEHPAEGIRKGSPEIQIIQGFLELLNLTEKTTVNETCSSLHPGKLLNLSVLRSCRVSILSMDFTKPAFPTS